MVAEAKKIALAFLFNNLLHHSFISTSLLRPYSQQMHSLTSERSSFIRHAKTDTVEKQALFEWHS